MALLGSNTRRLSAGRISFPPSFFADPPCTSDLSLIAFIPCSWAAQYQAGRLQGLVRTAMRSLRDEQHCLCPDQRMPIGVGACSTSFICMRHIYQSYNLHDPNHGGTQIPSRLLGYFSYQSSPQSRYS